MRLKTNFVISVLFIALLGFVYFYEIKGGEERRVEAERQRQMLDFSDHEVQRLTIDHGDTLLVVERQENAWRLLSPVETDADADAIDRYLRTLHEMEVEGDPVRDNAAIAADASIVNQYGLDAPRLRVHVGLLEDAEPLDSLRFGDDTPTDRFTYVQRSDTVNPEIMRVRAWRFDNLDKSIFDLRDRRLIAFEADEVRRLRLQQSGTPALEASRETGTWQLLIPQPRRADDSTINGILSSLQNAKTERIVSEKPTSQELVDAGLSAEQESIALTLWIGDDRVEKRLRVGASLRGGDDSGGLPATDTSRPHIFLVDSTLVRSLRSTAADLRDKKVFPIDSDQVTAIALHEGSAIAFSAQRDSAGTWTLPATPDREAKTWRLNSLLTDLNGLQAVRFAADAATEAELGLARFGLDAPQLSIVVTLSDGTTSRLQIGDSRDGEVFVLSDEVLSVNVVDEDAVEGLHLDLEDVSQEHAPQTKGTDADPASAQ